MQAIPRNSAQFNAIPRIFNCFLFNYSAIARNEMAQAKAPIARIESPIGNPIRRYFGKRGYLLLKISHPWIL